MAKSLLKKLSLLFTLIAAGTATARDLKLFVSSYAGSITSLNLSHIDRDGQYFLRNVSNSDGCGPDPTWLSYAPKDQLLYCVGEGLSTPNGSLSSYSIGQSGKLIQKQKFDRTIDGGVNAINYGGNGTKNAVALAHYFQTGGALSTFRTGSQGELTPLETHYFTIAKPGPVPGRQAASHAHQVVLDPTGKYLLVPDLGADLVRVFSIDLDNTVKAQDPLKMKPGTGPRHAVFWSPHHLANETSPIYLYVVAELGATLTGFQVTYNKAGLSFKQIHESGTTGNKPTPPGTAPAEIGVSPDNRFLILSNRNDSSYTLPNINAQNSTAMVSDSIATYRPNNNGTLVFTQLWPAGGRFPRDFAINAKGDLVAVGLQLEGRLVVMGRDVQTGNIKEVVADRWGLGGITAVVWGT